MVGQGFGPRQCLTSWVSRSRFLIPACYIDGLRRGGSCPSPTASWPWSRDQSTELCYQGVSPFPSPSLLSGAIIDHSLGGDMFQGTYTSRLASGTFSKVMAFHQGVGLNCFGAIQKLMPWSQSPESTLEILNQTSSSLYNQRSESLIVECLPMTGGRGETWKAGVGWWQGSFPHPQCV